MDSKGKLTPKSQIYQGIEVLEITRGLKGA